MGTFILTLKKKREKKKKKKERLEETFNLFCSKFFPREMKEKLTQSFIGQICNATLHLRIEHSSNMLSVWQVFAIGEMYPQLKISVTSEYSLRFYFQSKCILLWNLQKLRAGFRAVRGTFVVEDAANMYYVFDSSIESGATPSISQD